MAQQTATKLSTLEMKGLQPTTLMHRISRNITDAIILTRRNLTYYRRQPELLVFSTIQPVMFLLLFTYVFGSAIKTSAGDYINFLLPGILLQTVIFGGTAAAVGLAEDMKRGLIDRFRSLPMARSAVLAGRTIADTIRNLFVICLMLTVGYIIGFRFQNDVVHIVGAVALMLAFGHAMSWIFAFTGMLVKDPETAQVAGFVWVFPIVFASSIFVPTEGMTPALKAFAENQPVTIVANVVRAYFLDLPTDDLWRAIAWIVAIWLVFATIAIRQYGRTAN